jgi:hypothetical protein
LFFAPARQHADLDQIFPGVLDAEPIKEIDDIGRGKSEILALYDTRKTACEQVKRFICFSPSP